MGHLAWWPTKCWSFKSCTKRDQNCRDRGQDRDLSSRDRDETETFAYMPETRLSIGLETVSRPRRRDRDHIPVIMVFMSILSMSWKEGCNHFGVGGQDPLNIFNDPPILDRAFNMGVGALDLDPPTFEAWLHPWLEDCFTPAQGFSVVFKGDHSIIVPLGTEKISYGHSKKRLNMFWSNLCERISG